MLVRVTRLERAQAAVYGRVTLRRLDRRSPLLFHHQGIPIPLQTLGADHRIRTCDGISPLDYKTSAFNHSAKSAFKI